MDELEDVFIDGGFVHSTDISDSLAFFLDVSLPRPEGGSSPFIRIYMSGEVLVNLVAGRGRSSNVGKMYRRP